MYANRFVIVYMPEKRSNISVLLPLMCEGNDSVDAILSRKKEDMLDNLCSQKGKIRKMTSS